MTRAYETPASGMPPYFAQPAQLLQAFDKAKKQRDLEQMWQICRDLERGWSEVPVWQRGYNKISYQRQRLSPCVGFRPGNQEFFYQAYMQAVLDPEFRRLLEEVRA